MKMEVYITSVVHTASEHAFVYNDNCMKAWILANLVHMI